MYQVILASNSPRRRGILEQVGVTFTVIKSAVEEVITKTKPYEVVEELSMQKAEDVAKRLNPSNIEGTTIIIGADTVVAIHDSILGKPKDINNARQMLSLLQGSVHSVYTGVTIVILKGDEKQTLSFVEETKVEVFPMSESEIEHYLSCEEYEDKAGAYGIQGRFGAYIKGIQGDYYNVVGFPVSRFLKILKEQDINLLTQSM